MLTVFDSVERVVKAMQMNMLREERIHARCGAPISSRLQHVGLEQLSVQFAVFEFLDGGLGVALKVIDERSAGAGIRPTFATYQASTQIKKQERCSSRREDSTQRAKAARSR